MNNGKLELDKIHEVPHVLGNVNSFEYDSDDYNYLDNDLSLEGKNSIVFGYIISLVLVLILIVFFLVKFWG